MEIINASDVFPYDWTEEVDDGLVTQIDDITGDIEDLRYHPEKSSDVAIRAKELMFELLKGEKE